MQVNLIGTWRQVDAMENGEAIDQADEIILVMGPSSFAVKRNGTAEIQGTYWIDATRVPIALDWTDVVGTDAGKTF